MSVIVFVLGFGALCFGLEYLDRAIWPRDGAAGEAPWKRLEGPREAVWAWFFPTRLGQWYLNRSWDRYFRTDSIVLLELREVEADLALWDADPKFAASLGGERVWRGKHGIVVKSETEYRWGHGEEEVRERLEYADGSEAWTPWWAPPPSTSENRFGGVVEVWK